MIEFEGVTLAYAGRPVLREVTFAVPEGELVLVVGPTGSGKSSLLHCLTAAPPSVAVPPSVADASARSARHAHPGSGGPARLTGRVLVDGTDLHDRLSTGQGPLVAVVRQDPAVALDAGTVQSVIAAGVRARPDDPHAGQRQVEETLDLLGIADLRQRSVTELSGGQQQRVAIGVAIVAGPRVLVLDEPTSALDPVAAEDVLAILHRLVHDVGTTVLVAEHRLERVVHHADAVLLVETGQVTGPHDPATAMAMSTLHPPVVELGLRLGWDPVPLSVREARRAAHALRTTLATAASPSPPPQPPSSLPRLSSILGRPAPNGPGAQADRRDRGRRAEPPDGTAPLVDLRRVSLVRDQVVALRSVSLRVGPGEVVALMGRNGSGKSSLLGVMDGALPPTSGRVAGSRSSALAPQGPDCLLADTTVATRLAENDATHGLAPGSTARLLGSLAPELSLNHLPADHPPLDHLPADHLLADHRPADLSEGQRMCLALSLVLARGSTVVLLDEPTRGLDYAAKGRLTALLAERAAAGCAVVVATHDVELAAEVATRAVILAEGEVVADGPAPEVLAASPAFAPQVAKVMHPSAFLRVRDVVAALRPTTSA